MLSSPSPHSSLYGRYALVIALGSSSQLHAYDALADMQNDVCGCVAAGGLCGQLLQQVV